MYYLQSRYYNPEWGRFINADGLIGQTGQLLGHNMFAYCGNNPINMADPSGCMYYCPDWASRDKAVSDQYFSVYKATHSSSGGRGQGFNYEASIVKGGKSGFLDIAVEKEVGSQIKPKKVWTDLGKPGLGKYVDEFSTGAKAGKKALGVAGTVGFTLWDAGSSALKGEYVGAGIDIAAGGVSAGTGILISILTGSAVAAGAPVALMVGIGYGAGVLVGVLIDKYATYKKDEYYGR